MKKVLFLATIISLLHTIVHAQSKILSLEDTWEKVLKTYPSLEAKKENLESRHLQKELVRKTFLPDISVQAQQAYGSIQNTPGSFFPLPGIYTTNGISRSATASSAGSHMFSSALLHWDFMQFGRRKKRIGMADASIALGNSMIKEEEWKLLSSATRVYFQSLSSMAFLQNANEETRRLTELFELVKAQAEAGLRPGADTFMVKASILESRAKESGQLAELNTYLEQLAMLTGEEASSITVDTSLFYHYAMASASAISTSQLHPYLEMQESMIKVAEAEKASVMRDVYPSIGLLLGAGIKGSGISSDGQVHKGFGAPWQNAGYNYLAGIGITWNFSSLYENHTRRAIADRAIASAKASKEDARIQLQASYKSSLSRLDQQKERLQSSADALGASKEAYSLYEVRYQSGLLGLIELLQLQKNLREAETNYVRAIADYWSEWIRYTESLGDPSLVLAVIQP